ncbi:hypothetical protein [Desulfonatronum thiodismutans]|uniref:hypothetical protein n=1 Tax=Desulfonatronum thiodismutans TaxID=159290 RepID=UPI0004ABEBB7|nr:hypothetical protein [Desulfonatronum thiodismutans]
MAYIVFQSWGLPGAFKQFKSGLTTEPEEMMGEKKLINGVLCFVSGVLFASIVLFCLVTVPKADADSGISCMRTNLNAWGYRNTIPNSTIDIAYEIPGCIRSYGYTINNVYIQNGMVVVNYTMPSTKSKDMGAGDTTSGIVPF